MKTSEILKFCFEKGVLVDNEVLNVFNESGDTEFAKLIIDRIKDYTSTKIITKEIFFQNKDNVERFFSDFSGENKENLKRLKIKLGLNIEISEEITSIKPVVPLKDLEKPEIKKDNLEIQKVQEKDVVEKNILENSDVKIVSSYPITSKKLEVKDFVNYFKIRLSQMRDFLQERAELDNLVSLNKISGNNQGVSIIGMVYDKRITKNKNIIFEIEDLTGRVKVLINKDKKELYEKAEEVALDSVLGFKGSGNSEIIFANEIIFADIAISERKKSVKEEYVLFLGDLHVGSKLFMEENFLKFIEYLNGKVPNTPEVEKIKYIFIVGDLISGVGIYPGQENELEIDNVELQYQKVAELLGKIRKDIKIIISPGNHDALRIMEPQPILDEKYAWAIYNLNNVILTGNPCTINIGSDSFFKGFDILSYHGYSFHYYAGNISRLIKEKASHKPEKIMSYLLMNRHLAPTHSSTLYFPSEDDFLMIKKVPDIFVSAHMHKSAISYYNNILMVCASSWESITAFQEKMGNQPDFCKVPIFNLKTREVKIMDFE